MRSCSTAAAKDRCVFTSVLLLGALFALNASPCSRVPLVSAMVLIGVPVMTFLVAAPSRIGSFRELALFLRGAEATLLSGLLFLMGRRQDALRARDRQRARVESAYMAVDDRLGELVRLDPLRLHHARRLGFFGAMLTVMAGLSLPVLYPQIYTFGDWPVAPFVILTDVLVFGLVGRFVAERIVIRLLEATEALRGNDPWASRVRVLPISTLLGAALGMVGAFLVVLAGAAACAVETSWIAPFSTFVEPADWFLRTTIFAALPLGIGIGAVLGAGMGLAQPPKGLFPVRTETEPSEPEA